MAEQDSRDRGEQDSAAQPREELRGILDRAQHHRSQPTDPRVAAQTVDTGVNQVGQTARQALGPQGLLSQTLQQTSQRLGPQLGQTTEQIAQQTQQGGWRW
ncbi:hypothetical protein [Micromonospora rhizosphaerae]|uniref:hypothetical protein n=1 Tax=Micromonospora rhizosphaerae TaxID=568872 RepID=UPI000B82E145|nr:hypothetical protein [Micromonospora rhizosphaerae]